LFSLCKELALAAAEAEAAEARAAAEAARSEEEHRLAQQEAADKAISRETGPRGGHSSAAAQARGSRRAPAAREIRGSRTGGAIYRLAWGRERRRPFESPSVTDVPMTEPTCLWFKTLVDSA
jgi:hypothetical protein